MAPKEKLFADIGAVGKRGDEFPAQVQIHDQDHQKKIIWGPYRSDEASAKKDFARMRAAAVTRGAPFRESPRALTWKGLRLGGFNFKLCKVPKGLI